jgi:tRNA-specific 2-thiouridylase
MDLNKNLDLSKFSKKKIVVGVSGGVDSSVTLALLKEKGFDPIAVYLQIPVWNSKTNCFEVSENSLKNIDIIKNICLKLKVNYYILDTSKDFEKIVINYFLKEYKSIRTPNPCVFCNRYFKFKYLLDFANKNKIYFIATGHYSKILFSKKENTYKLYKAKDNFKDQSYGLSLLTSNQLKRIKFPLGNYSKKQIYLFAEKYNFNIFKNERQSQDICFLKNSNVNDYLSKNIPKKKGPIIDLKNNCVGKHNGLFLYTIGQRRGIGLSKISYVYRFDISKNQLIITNNKDDIKCTEVYLKDYNFINNIILTKPENFMCKIRYKHDACKAKIFPPINHKLKVVFSKPQSLVATGQYFVFYKKNWCVGCGVVENYN